MQNQTYDIAIIGSGFGGGAAAYALSHAGYKTVLIERGQAVARDEKDWDSKAILVEGRYKTKTPVEVSQFNKKQSDTFFNEVVGGQSIFYGGAAFRMRETDFDQWPISYFDLEPYYGEAETLLEIHGSQALDPFEPKRSSSFPYDSIPLTKPAERIHHAAKQLGYRPFPIPVAINHRNHNRPLCISCFTCDGFPCKLSLKNDVTTTLLQKADPNFLTIIDNTIAIKLIRENQKITSVRCKNKTSEKVFNIEAKVFIVSGGAIGSAALLLQSDLDLLDKSKALGRYLMRHYNAVVASIFPFKINPDRKNHKQVAITHFYEDFRKQMGTAVGVIQDMCMPPPEATRYHHPGLMGRIGASISEYIQGLICIAEDEPQFKNGVFLKNETDHDNLPLVRIEHEYTANDAGRLEYLVKKAKQILGKSGGYFHQVKKMESFSHAVGTTRFGKSPENSVLDVNCRFHALDNLFVLDGSFMPTSGGVNPSLTITANSLRVAEYIKNNFSQY